MFSKWLAISIANTISYKSLLMKISDVAVAAALVEGTIFCMHGGLSPNMQSFEQVYFINVYYNVTIKMTIFLDVDAQRVCACYGYWFLLGVFVGLVCSLVCLSV